jgi:hypothetical protein
MSRSGPGPGRPVTGAAATAVASRPLGVHPARQELLAFLRAARDIQVKILLISRGDEQAWLGTCPPAFPAPLSTAEFAPLIYTIAARHSVRVTGPGPSL